MLEICCGFYLKHLYFGGVVLLRKTSVVLNIRFDRLNNKYDLFSETELNKSRIYLLQYAHMMGPPIHPHTRKQMIHSSRDITLIAHRPSITHFVNNVLQLHLKFHFSVHPHPKLVFTERNISQCLCYCVFLVCKYPVNEPNLISFYITCITFCFLNLYVKGKTN